MLGIIGTPCRSPFLPRWVGCIVTCGVVGVSVLHPALAQPSLETGQILHMAQSDALSGSWRLVSMGELSSPAVVPLATELTAEFGDERIAGSGGCNRFMGSYETPQAGTLSIGPLASTFKACETPVMNQEMRYLQALQAAQRYEMNDQGDLAIFYQTEQESGVLRFTTQAVRGMW
jgi:heat shock protein HslJ